MTEQRVRKIDIGMIIQICTIGGFVLAAYSLPAKWDRTAEKVDQMSPIVWETKSRQDKLEAFSGAQWAEVLRRLDRIERKVDRAGS